MKRSDASQSKKSEATQTATIGENQLLLPKLHANAIVASRFREAKCLASAQPPIEESANRIGSTLAYSKHASVNHRRSRKFIEPNRQDIAVWKTFYRCLTDDFDLVPTLDKTAVRSSYLTY